MKTKSVILCGVSLITSSLLGSPFGPKIDEKLDKAYESFSALKVNLDEYSINNAYTNLDGALKEIEKINDINDYEMEGQIVNLKKDMKFLNDLKNYLNHPSSKQRLEQWANSNCRFIPIIQKAFSLAH